MANTNALEFNMQISRAWLVTGHVIQSSTQTQDLLQAQYFDRFKRNVWGKVLLMIKKKEELRLGFLSLHFQRNRCII